MPTVQVGPGSDLELQQIADLMGKSKKVVVVTGAGISTNCGIPDFRSENGLYSLIQAQYDAARQNPPWEQANTFDIDDRPKKKRRHWYYEVIAPDGQVVDVIDEELEHPKEEPHHSSRSISTNTADTRSSTPKLTKSQVVDVIDKKLEAPRGEPLSSRSRSTNTPDEDLETPKEEPRRSSAPRSTNRIGEEREVSKEESCRSSSSRSTNTTNSRSSTPKSTESSLTSLSSTTPELPDSEFQDPSYISLDADLSTLSQGSEAFHQSTQTPTTAAHLSRTTTDLSSSFQSTQASATTSYLSRTTSDFCSSSFQQTTETSVTTTNPSRSASDLSSRTLPNLKGRDLFDSMIWADPFTTSIFYMFISSLREKIQNVSSTTKTHKFIRVLRDGGKLVRNYTQNIDMLEEREGLCQDLEKGPGSKGRFSIKQKEARQPGVGSDLDKMGGCESVPLHGSLQRLRCNLCGKPSSWDDEEVKRTMYAGSATDCQRCASNSHHRTSRGRRSLAVGRLRPDIVLYGEEHPHSNLISQIVTHDLSLGPDVLLIMGTSLRVHGLKVMIREFAKAVHTKGGKVVFVNQTKPSESIWGDFIDYWVNWDCDEWVMDLRDRREDIWTGVAEEKHSSSNAKKWRPQALRDDKTNGVYLTFKILDTLSKAQDKNGQPASRFPYWHTSRMSDMSLPPRPQKKVGAKKGQSKNKKPLPKKPTTKPAKSKAKRKSTPEEEKRNIVYIVTKQWENLRKIAPNLPAPPPELRLPFSEFVSNRPDWYKPFAFHASSNHLPNVGNWPLNKMNLVTHPPSGTTIPIYTPKTKAKTEERPKIRHGYGTRASRRFSSADTIVVDHRDTVEHEDTIVVAEDPMTPVSRRIKRSCSIGALMSSSPEQEIWHDAPEVMT